MYYRLHRARSDRIFRVEVILDFGLLDGANLASSTVQDGDFLIIYTSASVRSVIYSIASV